MADPEDSEFTDWSSITVGDVELEFDDWRPNRPRTDKEIWRYRSIEHYASILEDGALWFSRPDVFNDPLEGSLPSVNVFKRSMDYNDAEAKRRSNIRALYRYTTYMNCWYNGDHESDAMWRLYTDEESNALAIKTTPADLYESLGPSDSVTTGNIEYRDYSSFELKTENPIAPLFFKRKAFQFENEFRAVVHHMSESATGEDTKSIGDLQPEGKPVPVDINNLIHEVVLSPSASDEYEQKVREITKEHGHSFDIERSDLDRVALF